MDHEASPQNLPEDPPTPSPHTSPIFRWVEEFQRHLEPAETPLTTSLLGPPRPGYCLEHISEPVEPEHGIWLRLSHLLNRITPEDDDEWYTWEPTDQWRDLSQAVSDLKKIAFRQIPNPEYDADRCEEWHRDHPRRRGIEQTKAVWGMSELVGYQGRKEIGRNSTDSTS